MNTQKTAQNKLLRAAGTAAGLLLGWAAIENTALLQVSRYEADIPDLPRTVQISDLHKRHFGRGQRRLIRKVAALKPELIVVTGDLISRTVTDFTDTQRLLRRLTALAPVLVANGNHEADLPPAILERFRQAVRHSGALLLENQTVTVNGIPFAGLYLPSVFYRGGGLFGFTGAADCTAETLLERLGDCKPNTVLLAHNPMFFPAYAEWGAKLTLSGHVHGGIVRLPGIGGLLSPERRFLPHFDKGAFRQGDSEMILSAGLGKLRLFNPPELCLITSKTTDSPSD